MQLKKLQKQIADFSFYRFFSNYCYQLSIISLLSFALASCSNGDCVTCKSQQRDGYKSRVLYNVELKEFVKDPCDNSKMVKSIITDVIPEKFLSCEENEPLIRVFPIQCSDSKMPDCKNIPQSKVADITTTSNGLYPPKQVTLADPCVFCERERSWMKLELRAMGGYRGTLDNTVYPTPRGDTVYMPQTFGFDRGGSTIVIGGELSAMIRTFNQIFRKQDAFQIGLLSGVWPMDGSTFIPVTLHLRYTENEKPCKYERCGTWYLFADAGMPFAPFNKEVKAPVTFKYRTILGFGLGYEWDLGKNFDFGIDFGYRYIRTPLPAYEACPEVSDSEKNPYRASNVGFLRFGLTF